MEHPASVCVIEQDEVIHGRQGYSPARDPVASRGVVGLTGTEQTHGMKALWRLVGGLLVLLLVACSEPDFPRDPEGTLLRATDGVLRVGASTHAPYVEVSDSGQVGGSEAEIMRGYAESIDAEIEWVEGAEGELMERLKLGEVDVVIGGLPSDTPWVTHAALTRPYRTATGPEGDEIKLVMATRLGENALLSSLERHLISEGLLP